MIKLWRDFQKILGPLPEEHQWLCRIIDYLFFPQFIFLRLLGYKWDKLDD